MLAPEGVFYQWALQCFALRNARRMGASLKARFERHKRRDRRLDVCISQNQTAWPDQYVARPPLMSKTAPVVNELSSEATHAISAAISSGVTNRPRGIRDSMKSMCEGDI